MTRSVPTDPRARASAVESIPARQGRSGGAPVTKARHISRSSAVTFTKPTTIPIWSKAQPVSFAADASVDDAIAAVFAGCHAHWRANVAAAMDGRDPEGIHQLRVALRRMRSALSAFKKFIPGTQRLWLRDEAKWLLGQLGLARDLDVFIHDLATPLATGVADNAGFARLMRAARLADTQAHTNAVRMLESVRVSRFLARLQAWVEGRGWHNGARTQVRDSREITSGEFGSRLVNRRVRNILADYSAVERLSVDERHDLRIAVKKTRYDVEFFQPALPAKRAQRLTSVLKDLQDNLGHLNDIEVAERTITMLVKDAATDVERRHIAAAGTAVTAWHRDAAVRAEPELAKLWRKLKKAPAL